MFSCCRGEAGHRRGIWTQISFSVQMPGPREVILGQKSANSSLQEHYCWSKELNKWSKVPTTGRVVTSNPLLSLAFPFPPSPPPPGLNIDRCITTFWLGNASAVECNYWSLHHFVIWLAPWVGKMNQILHCDWLPKQTRWHSPACSGSPAACVLLQECAAILTSHFIFIYLRSDILLFMEKSIEDFSLMNKSVTHHTKLTDCPFLCRLNWQPMTPL